MWLVVVYVDNLVMCWIEVFIGCCVLLLDFGDCFGREGKGIVVGEGDVGCDCLVDVGCLGCIVVGSIGSGFMLCGSWCSFVGCVGGFGIFRF